VHEAASRVEGKPLDVQLDQSTELLFESDELPCVAEGLSRIPVREPSCHLVAENESEPDRYLAQEVAPAVRKDRPDVGQEYSVAGRHAVCPSKPTTTRAIP
jgi:hypothetical protein